MEPLSAFQAIRERCAARRFSSKPIRDQLLYELLELANRAPSGYNLQPWHFILVRDQELKGLLCHAALGQEQILTAPATVVFVANPRAWKDSYPRVLSESISSGAMSAQYAEVCRKNVDSLFSIGLFGLWGLVKKITTPVRRLSAPTPPAITSAQEAEHYVRSHTMLAAATFMVAASSAGLATCPMEGFDEERLKRLLAIPARMVVPVIVPVGYPMEGDQTGESIRLPLLEKLSIDLFPNKLQKLKERMEEE